MRLIFRVFSSIPLFVWFLLGAFMGHYLFRRSIKNKEEREKQEHLDNKSIE